MKHYYPISLFETEITAKPFVCQKPVMCPFKKYGCNVHKLQKHLKDNKIIYHLIKIEFGELRGKDGKTLYSPKFTITSNRMAKAVRINNNYSQGWPVSLFEIEMTAKPFVCQNKVNGPTKVYTTKNGTITCKSCNIGNEKLIESVGINQIIKNLKIKCVNKGDLDEESDIDLIREESGCNWIGLTSQFDDHILNKCEFRRVLCEYCGFKDIKRNVIKHYNICDKRVLCPFKQYGCNADVDNLDTHLKNYKINHQLIKMQFDINKLSMNVQANWVKIYRKLDVVNKNYNELNAKVIHLSEVIEPSLNVLSVNSKKRKASNIYPKDNKRQRLMPKQNTNGNELQNFVRHSLNTIALIKREHLETYVKDFMRQFYGQTIDLNPDGINQLDFKRQVRQAITPLWSLKNNAKSINQILKINY